MKLTKEEFKETKIQLPDEETALEFLTELNKIGITFTSAAWIRFVKFRTYYIGEELNLMYSSTSSLEAQIKDFPEQLAKAVEAAKADVTINQDNKK